MTSHTPLQRYLVVQRGVDRELAAILRDAAQEGERIIERLLGRSGTGAAMERRQVAEAVRALRGLQAEMWGSVTRATAAGMVRAGEQVATSERLVNSLVYKRLGLSRDTVALLDRAMQVRAQNSVVNYIARLNNGISLSDQVYRTEALANGLVEREVNRGLLLGRTGRQIATAVKGLISPSTPGGVSYAANRLARTEINNAFHRAQIDQRKDSPFTIGFQWHLSGSHPRPDECNDFADKTHYGGGDPGVFKASEVPNKPHPNCLCYLTTVQKDDAVLDEEFLAGKYDVWLSQQALAGMA